LYSGGYVSGTIRDMDSTISTREFFSEKVFTVSEYIDFLNNVLAATPVLVTGEVGAKMSLYPRFGYFSLLDSDQQALLDCFAWRNSIDGLGTQLEEGMQVKVFGYPSIYKPKGTFNFHVQRIELIGEGGLKKQFELLKQKLKDEGLFDAKNKQEIIDLPTRIGLITSARARGAKKDFLTNLISRRLKVEFYDVRVEGDQAISDICNAIKWFNEHTPHPDVLVVTRGGGSWESLQAFNSEQMARAIFASKIPIVVGVGHEDDETIADFVCDFRASTPTDAAKVLSKSWGNMPYILDQYSLSFGANITLLLQSLKQQLTVYAQTWENNMVVRIEKIKVKISNYESVLKLSDPFTRVRQGYALLRGASGSLVTSVSHMHPQDNISIQVSDGTIESSVTRVVKEVLQK